MKIKKIFSSLMALSLSVTLSACSGNTNEPGNNASDSADTTVQTEITDDAATESNDVDTDVNDDTDTEDADTSGTDTDESNDIGADLNEEDQQELDNFEDVTSSDRLVIGSGEFNGDFLEGWTESSTDVNVRNFLGISGVNGYVTTVQDENGQWVNNPVVLAKEPETTLNEDGSKTITFTINDGLKWSDGEPVTVDDYLFPALLYSHPSYVPVTGSTTFGPDSRKGYEEYHNGDLDYLEGQARVSDNEFSITLDSSFLPYFEEESLYFTRPFPIHAISDKLTVNEEGNKLVAKEGYEPTKEEIAAFHDSIKTQIEVANETFDEYYPEPEEDADEDEIEEYKEAKVEHEEDIAYLESRLEGDIDPTQQLIEQAMLNQANEYRLNPTVVDGPYVLDSYENNIVKLSLNPNYAGNFRGDKATIPHVVLQVVNPSIAIDLIENGKIDVWEDESNSDAISQIKAAADEGKLQFNSFEQNAYSNISFLTDKGATKYKQVRQAIAHLMDRNTFVQSTVGGYGVVINGMYGISQWMYQERGADLERDPEFTNYQLNIDKANELLDETPYKFEADGTTPWDRDKANEMFESNPEGFDYWRYDEEGNQLVVNQYGYEESKITTLISNQLPNNAKQAGMEYNVQQGAWATLLEFYHNPKEDAEYTAFNMGSGFPMSFDPYYYYHSDGFDNSTRTNDPEVDRITVELRQTDPDDKEGYLDKWEEFQKWYNDYLPEIPLYSSQAFTAYSNRVQGFDIVTPVWGVADQINALTLSE